MDKVVSCFVIVAMAIGFSALFAFLGSLLWNWLIPEIFNGPEITFWQMWGLLALVSLVTSSVKR